MSQKLAHNEEIRRSLVADVAHELRTPFDDTSRKVRINSRRSINPTEEVILELTDEVYRLSRLVKIYSN